jgi:hypothetical protein
MSLALAAVALAVPLLLGVALLAWCRSRASVDDAGIVSWTIGAGFIVGVLAVTTIMRVDAVAGIPFGWLSIGVPSLVLAAALAWLARRGPSSMPWSAAACTLVAPKLERRARLAWFALLAWIAARAAMLLVEVASRPLYAWDAWSAWATKAKAYFAMRTIVPFVDLASWSAATTPAWFDAQPKQPATLPLLQAWIASAIGAWDDASVALPWWLFFVALVLVVYGEVRRRGAPPLHALVGAWLVATLPLAGTQVALAGYADLPLAAAFALGALAGVRAVRTRSWVDIVAAAAALASCALYKASGFAWIVVALPGLAAAALGRPWHRRLAVVVLVAAIAIAGIAARFPNLVIGPISFLYAPVWDSLLTESVLLANWHLVALGVAGTLVLRYRRIVDADMAPLTLILAAGAVWIATLVAFPSLRLWGADFLGLNRATLVWVPFAIAWMAIAMLEAPAKAVQPAAPIEDVAPAEPSPEPA